MSTKTIRFNNSVNSRSVIDFMDRDLILMPGIMYSRIHLASLDFVDLTFHGLHDFSHGQVFETLADLTALTPFFVARYTRKVAVNDSMVFASWSPGDR